MPDFSLHLPRFLRSRRSHSPKPSPAGSRHDAAASQPPYLSPSPALSSRPRSTRGAPKQVDYAATGTSRLLAPSNQTHPQNSTDRLHVDRASGDSSGQPMQVSRPTTPISVVEANSASTGRFQGTIAQPRLHRPQVPESTGSLLPEHASCSLTTPSQQSFILERQSVRLSYMFCL
jgi:hypothetical protein